MTNSVDDGAKIVSEEVTLMAEPMPYLLDGDLPVLETKEIVDPPTPNETLIQHPVHGEDWNFYPPSSDIQLLIQEELAANGNYIGKQNGKWGNLTVYAIGEIVGLHSEMPSKELCILVQDYAEELGDLVDMERIDGNLTQTFWEAFAKGLAASNIHH
jgi:hypothetical protein